MKQERLKILGMLEEGKVSAEEAAMLLDKLNQAAEAHHAFLSDDTAEHVEETLSKFAKNAETFAKEFCSKAASAYKDVEPKLKKASQAVLEKTAIVVDEIACSLHETIDNARARAEAEKNCCGEGNDCTESCDENKNDDTPTPN
ncbi:MAG: hypothetical protein FWC91_04025 [Defluviitaleaceae bacterium]|nr:hypothetical protein [Defluviitaleaceae bacterium]